MVKGQVLATFIVESTSPMEEETLKAYVMQPHISEDAWDTQMGTHLLRVQGHDLY